MEILIIISGSVAAYKACEIIRELKKANHKVTAILTKGGEEFITALQVSALTGTQTYTDIFNLKDETEMGHIRLSRENDLILIAPASADILAKMAHGFASDLATATLLASDKKIYAAPAMNVEMWNKAATKRNIAQLKEDGVIIIEPQKGELACGEVGDGKMAEILEIIKAIA